VPDTAKEHGLVTEVRLAGAFHDRSKVIMTNRLFAVTFDCADAAAVGGFWARALGQELDPGAGTEFASIGLHDSGRTEPRWCFAQVPEGKSAKNRMHPDLITADLEAEVGRLIGLGASRKKDVTTGGMRWTTLLDPEGNEFDVIAEAA
jgi:Glyoxalase-like domain